jgi:hypothetical protein
MANIIEGVADCEEIRDDSSVTATPKRLTLRFSADQRPWKRFDSAAIGR